MTGQEANLRRILRNVPYLLPRVIAKFEEMERAAADPSTVRPALTVLREIQREIGSLNLPSTRIQYPPRDIGATSIQKGGQAGWPDLIDPTAM